MFVLGHVRHIIISLLLTVYLVIFLLFNVETAVVTASKIMRLIFLQIVVSNSSIIIIWSKTAIPATNPHTIDEPMATLMFVDIQTFIRRQRRIRLHFWGWELIRRLVLLITELEQWLFLLWRLLRRVWYIWYRLYVWYVKV